MRGYRVARVIVEETCGRLNLTGERYIIHRTSVGVKKPIEDQARSVENRPLSRILQTEREGVRIALSELKQPTGSIKELLEA